MEESLLRIAQQAGDVLCRSFRQGERHIDDHTASGDADSQVVIVRALYKEWPLIPIVVEEGIPEIVAECLRQCPGAQLITIPKQGGLVDTIIPDTCFIVDPRDGSALAVNGCPEYSVSIGLKDDGRLIAGAIYLPEFQAGVTVSETRGVEYLGMKPLPVLKNRPEMSMIGLDSCRAVPDEFRDQVILPLTKAFRYVRNLPSVASGWELAIGRTRAWVSDRAMIWDVAATAPMIFAKGGVVECLDGSPVPWDRPKMPPLLFADSPEVAAYVRRAIGR